MAENNEVRIPVAGDTIRDRFFSENLFFDREGKDKAFAEKISKEHDSKKLESLSSDLIVAIAKTTETIKELQNKVKQGRGRGDLNFEQKLKWEEKRQEILGKMLSRVDTKIKKVVQIEEGSKSKSKELLKEIEKIRDQIDSRDYRTKKEIATTVRGQEAVAKRDEQNSKWSTDTQNKIAKEIAKEKLATHTVQKGETLGAIVKGLTGKLNWGMEVDYRSNKLKKKPSKLAEADKIYPGQKVWIKEGKVIVADEVVAVAVKKQVVKDPEVEKFAEIPAEKLKTALVDLTVELKKANPNLQKLLTLRATVEQIKNLLTRHSDIGKDPLQAADKLIANMQAAEKLTEKAKRLETAGNAVQNLENLLGQSPTSAKEIEVLMAALNNQEKSAVKSVGALEQGQVGNLKINLDAFQKKVQPKLDELKPVLVVMKEEERKFEIKKQKKEKFEKKLEVNRKKLESLQKINEGSSNLGSVLVRAILAVGASLGEIKEEISRGKFSRLDLKEKAFVIEPSQVEIGVDTFRSASFKSIRLERSTKEKSNLLIRFEADESRALVGREGTQILEVADLFKTENLKKISKESAVRFWNGKEVGKFWKFDAHNNNSRNILIAHVKINGEPGWIRVAESGEITDRAGKKLSRKALHKNDLNVIESKLSIHLAEEK